MRWIARPDPELLRKNQYLRGYGYHFIELLAPHLTRDVVAQALHLTS